MSEHSLYCNDMKILLVQGSTNPSGPCRSGNVYDPLCTMSSSKGFRNKENCSDLILKFLKDSDNPPWRAETIFFRINPERFLHGTKVFKMPLSSHASLSSVVQGVNICCDRSLSQRRWKGCRSEGALRPFSLLAKSSSSPPWLAERGR